MATKSTLITAVNGFIANVVSITKHRNSMLEIIDTLFQTTYVMSNVAGPDQFTYTLRFKKIGNVIWVDGTVKNEYTSGAHGNVSLVTIDNSEFYAKTGQDTKGFVVGENSLSNGLLKFTTNSIFLETNIGNGNTIRINNHYQCND